MAPENTVTVAIQGCCHGSLTGIYNSLDDAVELLIICGDFQALRNTTDFCTISVPPKYLQMGDFHLYYSGELVAPVRTIFIGGNHESSLYMTELQYGGWVARNIYFLGKFGSVWFRGLQIGGWSGIFNESSFTRNPIDDVPLPYSPSTLRLVYHHTPKSFLKMCLLDQSLDIAISHDWPQGVERFGNTQKLIKQKPFFRKEIESNLLGNPLNMFLLQSLRPLHWFSAHLHVGFAAVVNFDEVKGLSLVARDGYRPTDDTHEISVDMDSELEEKECVLVMNGPESNNSLSSGRPKAKDGVPTDLGIEEIDCEGPRSTINNATLRGSDSMNRGPVLQTQKLNNMEITINMDEIDADNQGLKRASSISPYHEGIADLNPNGRGLNQLKDISSEQTSRLISTKFHALDKCGRNRHLLEILKLPIKEENSAHPSRANFHLYHSVRAIAINKVVEKYVDAHRSSFESINMAAVARDPRMLTVIDELRPLVNRETKVLMLRDPSNYIIDPDTFIPVCPTSQDSNVPLQWWPNPQTDSYCQMLDIKPPVLHSDATLCSAAAARARQEISRSHHDVGEDLKTGSNKKAKNYKKFRRNFT